MESFVAKVAILGAHLPSYERNAITWAGFTTIWHSTSKGSRAQMVRLFFWSSPTVYLAGRCCENFPSVKGPAQI